MDNEIVSILESHEKVIWDGKQDLKSALVKGFVVFILMIIFGGIFLFISSINTGTCTVNGQVRPAEECGGIFGWVAYGVFALAILVLIFNYLSYKVTHYLITSKRILLKSGIIGADMRSIYYDQIRSAFVDVGVIGKMFGTGTIKFDTGRMTSSKNGTQTDYDRFSYIKDPYVVYKYVQEHLSGRKESLYSGRADKESQKH